MKRNIVSVIPAQTKNRYSKKGDLEDFSGVTLLEWKISQIKRLKYVDKIFVLSKEKKIEKICKENKVPEIFALTTQSSHWFIQHGFSEKKLSQLPRKRLAMYNNGRNSKTLSKKIL